MRYLGRFGIMLLVGPQKASKALKRIPAARLTFAVGLIFQQTHQICEHFAELALAQNRASRDFFKVVNLRALVTKGL
jgi:hypothetical protein